jgi:hypothetical protein
MFHCRPPHAQPAARFALPALSLVLALTLLGAPPSGSATENTRSTKLGQCSKDAKEKGLKGDERKAFVSQCAGKKKTQGDKMGACSKQAADKGLKGDERSKFLSDCGKS